MSEELKDKYYTKSFLHYQVLGWQHLMGMTEFSILQQLCAMEQSFNYGEKSFLNKSLDFSLSDKQIRELLPIKSNKTVSNAISKLISLGLISTKQDRRNNSVGYATEYIITKPIPLPEEINTPEIFETIIPNCKEVIEDLKEMHREKNDSETNENYAKEQEWEEEYEDEVIKIYELLICVEAFNRPTLKKEIKRLLGKYSYNDVEQMAEYFKREGCETNVKTLFGYMGGYIDKNIKKNTGKEKYNTKKNYKKNNTLTALYIQKEY